MGPLHRRCRVQSTGYSVHVGHSSSLIVQPVTGLVGGRFSIFLALGFVELGRNDGRSADEAAA